MIKRSGVCLLYGLNTATYKIALGQCLCNFTEADKTHITMDGVKKSGGALLILGTLAVGVKKYGPKVVKAATKVIKK